MARQDLLARISIDPNVCFGKPCIRGTRIWVSLVLDFLATGTTTEELLQEYPQLTQEDVRACLLYGAETARGRYFDVAVEAAHWRLIEDQAGREPRTEHCGDLPRSRS